MVRRGGARAAARAAAATPPTPPTGAGRVLRNATYSSPHGFLDLNPFLQPSDYAGLPAGPACDGRGPGDVCANLTAIFSGLAVSPRSGSASGERRYLGITDRGPNEARAPLVLSGSNGKGSRAAPLLVRR